MKKQFVKVFNWLSKHLKTILLIVAIATTFLKYLKTEITLPLWVLYLTFLVPFVIVHLHNLIFIQKRKLKPGNSVKLKGTDKIFLIKNYTFLSKTNVVCVETTFSGNKATFHQDMLALYSLENTKPSYISYSEKNERY